MSKNALIVGINHYEIPQSYKILDGCVKDARDICNKIEYCGRHRNKFCMDPKLCQDQLPESPRYKAVFELVVLMG